MVTVDLTFLAHKFFDMMGEYPMSSLAFGVAITVIIAAFVPRYLCAWIVKNALVKPEIQAFVRDIVKNSAPAPSVIINNNAMPDEIDGGGVEMPK